MGIPRLRQHLRPYGKVTNIHDEFDKEDSKLVVDGSAFAHFIYWRLYNHQDPALGIIDAQPSYEELGREAVRFLDDLEGRGCRIHRVYFDGFLPDEKIETRRTRLNSSLKTSQHFRRAHRDALQVNSVVDPDKSPVEPTLDHMTVSRLFEERPSSETLCGRLAAPFIVPAVIEALRESQFRMVTELVPGEAESYCAHKIQIDGGILLTNDSDALLYDLETRDELAGQGSVAFLNELEMVRTVDGLQRLRAVIYRPAQIAATLGVPSLFLLADQLVQHESWSLSRLASHLKDKRERALKDGRNLGPEFLTRPDAISVQEIQVALFDEGLFKHFQRKRCKLDPRLSELVLNLAKKSPVGEAYVYMMPLLEDTQRKTAWTTGREIRELAYWCLAISCCAPDSHAAPTIVEYARKGDRLVETRWDMSGDKNKVYSQRAQELEEELSHLDAHLAKSDDDADVAFRWRSLALRRLIKADRRETAKGSCPGCAEKRICGVGQTELSWIEIHDDAQIEAYLYSLRILKQTLDYVASYDDSPVLLIEIRDLHRCLEDLPPLAWSLPTRRQLRQLARTCTSCHSPDDIAGYLSCTG